MITITHLSKKSGAVQEGWPQVFQPGDADKNALIWYPYAISPVMERSIRNV